MENHRLTGIIVIEAMLINESPLLIGSGSNENADKEIMRRPDGNPYIPGTALAGKILRLFKQNLTEFDTESLSFKQFWGIDDEKKQAYQSHIVFEDAVLQKTDFLNTTVRDGVEINAETNLADDKAKFDYELLEPNHQFKFRAEIKIRTGFQNFVRFADLLIRHLNNFQIGANEKTGFGMMIAKNITAHHFDFSDKTESQNWFKYLDGRYLINENNLKVDNPIEVKQTSVFKMVATFSLKSTILTASYGVNSSDPDKVQLSRKKDKNKQEYILSGAAIRGALRHRAKRILNTQGHPNPDDFLNVLFGIVIKANEEESKKSKASKSRLIIEEAVFTDNSTVEQTRIKIDRFTGGTIKGALLDAKPLTRSNLQKITLNFKIKDYKTEDTKLMLFLLKDLWTSDLAIGGEKNIGRGLLLGESATLFFNEDKIVISKQGINEEDKKKLETLLNL